MKVGYYNTNVILSNIFVQYFIISYKPLDLFLYVYYVVDSSRCTYIHWYAVQILIFENNFVFYTLMNSINDERKYL